MEEIYQNSNDDMASLLKKTFAGDAAARDELILSLWNTTSRMVVHRFKNSWDAEDLSLAEDVTHDIIVKILDNGTLPLRRCLEKLKRVERAPQTGEPFMVEKYIAVIISNAITDYFRRKRDKHRAGVRMVSLAECPEPAARNPEEPDAAIPDEDMLIAGLNILAKAERRVVDSYRKGRSTDDIAADMGIKEATVRSHWSHAIAKLKIFFDKDDFSSTS